MNIGYDAGYFKKGHDALVDEAYKIMLTLVRPQAIPLVELMNLPDEILQTAIGNYYGDIYETHFKWAKESRLNQTPGAIPKGFNEHVLPILKGKL